MNRLSLKIKLSIVLSLVISLSSATLGFALFKHSQKVVMKSFEQRGILLAQNLAYNSWYGVFTEDKVGLDALIQGVLRLEETVFGVVLSREGRILSQQNKQSFPLDSTKWDLVSEETNPEEGTSVHSVLSNDGTKIFIFSVPVISIASSEIEVDFPLELLEEKALNPSDLEQEGLVRIGLSTELLNRQIERMFVKGIFVTLFMVSVGIGVACFLVGRFSRPLEVLAISAQKVAAGDLSQKLPVKSQDEIGMLSQLFNQMIQSLSHRDGQMKELNHELTHLNLTLEARVRARTSELEDALQEINKEKKKTEHILQEIADGVIVSNERDEIVLMNAAAKKMLSATLQQGENLIPLAAIPSLHAIFKNESQIAMGEFETNEAAASQSSTLHVAVASLKEEFGDPVGKVAVMHDITQLKALDRLKSEFVSQVSHELRTPLTSIKGYIDNLLDGIAGQLTSSQHDYLSRMDKNTERLVRLIEDLLDISRIESGTMRLQLQSLFFPPLLEEVVSGLRPLAASQQLTLDLADFSGSGYVIGDRDKLIQVVTNLVYNAIKFTPPSGKITLTLSVKEDSLITSIRDDGVGISEKDLEHIFDRFYTADQITPNLPGGTGLGLSIAKNLMTMQGGALWVESEVGNGATFSFSLPLFEETKGKDGSSKTKKEVLS